MQKEKRRPELGELKSSPELCSMELSQVLTDAVAAGRYEVSREASALFDEIDLTAEKVVALREKLQRASGSTTPGCLSQMAENMEVKS